jgi:hypothetical protein
MRRGWGEEGRDEKDKHDGDKIREFRGKRKGMQEKY